MNEMNLLTTGMFAFLPTTSVSVTPHVTDGTPARETGTGVTPYCSPGLLLAICAEK
jgi:hypothetical protein